MCFAKLRDIAKILDVPSKKFPDIKIKNISIDTRSMESGALFIAIRGTHFNGHTYVPMAQKLGAVAVVAEEKITQYKKDTKNILPIIYVNDTRLALGKIGKWVRIKSKAHIFAITGSNGKTTAKNMLGAILSREGETLITQGNFNNALGVPLTLCRLREKHRYAVIEMGANHLGEIAYLCTLARPDVAVITNVSEAHLGAFGSLYNTVRAKGEIYASLGAKNRAIINQQCPYREQWQKIIKTKNRLSFNAGGDVFARNICETEEGLNFSLFYQNKFVNIKMRIIGRHQVQNALAAAACALSEKISLDKVRLGLAKVSPEVGRLNVIYLKHLTLIDDTYNANPASMRAAIDTLIRFKNKQFLKNKRVLVLGIMAELGETSTTKHVEVVDYAHTRGISHIYSFGKAAYIYRVTNFETLSALANHLLSVHSHSTILIKASRIARLESLVNLLKKLDLKDK